MIEVKNNQCVALADLQSVPYEYFYESVCTHKFRCMSIAARRNGEKKVDAYALFVSATNTLYLEYIEFASKEYDALDNFTIFAKNANAIVKEGNIGIYGCRSGLGMSMASNRCKGIRGALCVDSKFAEMSRKHNNANVCILPCDYITTNKCIEIIDTFLNTDFLGGKYQIRCEELDEIE